MAFDKPPQPGVFSRKISSQESTRRLRRAMEFVRHHGLLAFLGKTCAVLSGKAFGSYRRWIALYDRIDPDARRQLMADVARMPAHPVLSLIVPAAQDPALADATIDALQSQIYPHWELFFCIGDSSPRALRTLISDRGRQDNRIRLAPFDIAAGWAERANQALKSASGEFIAMLDAGDRLPEHALYCVVREALMHPNAALIFSDEDEIGSTGARFNPWFKPDWNPALMLSCNAVGRLAVFSRALAGRLGGFREGFEGAEEYDLALRCARASDAGRIHHIPRVLYHRHAAARGRNDAARGDAAEAGRRAASEYLEAQGITATVRRARGGNQVVYAAPNPIPRVSVIVATTARPDIAGGCLASLAGNTEYDDLEVIVLVRDADLERPERAEFLRAFAEKTALRIIRYPSGSFNYSSVNNLGAREASGDILCFLNDDTEALAPDWLQQLACRVSLPGVAAVGPMLYYPNGTIQHAGVILGLAGVARHACCHEPHGSFGYFGRACLEQDVSCVTAACMVIRANVFRMVGGFDEELPLAYNDVDLCLRVRALNWRIIWTPLAKLLHRESASLGRHDSPPHLNQYARDVMVMRERWDKYLQSDPFYNPNLSLDRAHGLAFPPRIPPANRLLS